MTCEQLLRQIERLTDAEVKVCPCGRPIKDGELTDISGNIHIQCQERAQ
jgi:hypothetical protein